MPSNALVVGASRGFGFELTKILSEENHRVFGTMRSLPKEKSFPENVTVIDDVDVAEPDAGAKIVQGVKGAKLDLVIINAGRLSAETLGKPDFEEEVLMYKTVAIAPVFIVHHLVKSKAFAENAKVILVTTEGGSITLRTPEEGGGMFGHHGSKAAANMVGKLLANELGQQGVTVMMIHPGFMRTEMTKNVGFDEFYDSGGAVEPSVAARSTIDFIKTVTPEMAGTFWAPRGPRDIGEAERVMGKDLPTPLRLPW